MATTPLVLNERADQPEAKARLVELIQSQRPGFTVECNDDVEERGLRVRIERADDTPGEFFIEDEVLADHTPKGIIHGLVRWNWMLFLGECRKRGVIPHFTNAGLCLPGDPHLTRFQPGDAASPQRFVRVKAA